MQCRIITIRLSDEALHDQLGEGDAAGDIFFPLRAAARKLLGETRNAAQLAAVVFARVKLANNAVEPARDTACVGLRPDILARKLIVGNGFAVLVSRCDDPVHGNIDVVALRIFLAHAILMNLCVVFQTIVLL